MDPCPRMRRMRSAYHSVDNEALKHPVLHQFHKQKVLRDIFGCALLGIGRKSSSTKSGLAEMAQHWWPQEEAATGGTLVETRLATAEEISVLGRAVSGAQCGPAKSLECAKFRRGPRQLGSPTPNAQHAFRQFQNVVTGSQRPWKCPDSRYRHLNHLHTIAARQT
jgi:hypothetical protein